MREDRLMRQFAGTLVAGAALFVAVAAEAAPAVEIRNAAAQVIVTPEPRSDIKVELVRTNARLPLRIWRFAGRTFVDGGLQHRLRGCRIHGGAAGATIAGVGETPLSTLPEVVIHTPLDARVFAGGAVWGSVGRSNDLEFANAGCGEWVIANVRGRMKVSLAGTGAARTGQSGSAELYSAGAGSISTREVADGAVAMNFGSGQIQIASVNGPFTARIAGAGSVRAAAGRVSAMQAQVAGSGGISLDGVADRLQASIVGSGDVRVGRVTGPVRKDIIGSGIVRVGS
jgi:hypothetical protein